MHKEKKLSKQQDHDQCSKIKVPNPVPYPVEHQKLKKGDVSSKCVVNLFY